MTRTYSQIDASFASNNPSRFRKNLLERIQKLIMTADDKIRDQKCSMILIEKQQKTSALSSRKLDKYQYLTGEETLPSSQRQIIEQTKFAYSPLRKA